MSITTFAETLNKWGANRTPFLFMMDFEMERPLAFPLHEISSNRLLYDINGITNCREQSPEKTQVDFAKFPLSLQCYKEKYDRVRSHLALGDSYLTNLTVRTQVKTGLSLKEMFLISNAKYKILFEDSILVFSPETFVAMRDGKIFTFPMKGTADASMPDAATNILANKKEMAEHVTIVDLLRNDLSTVSENVSVTRFRYIDHIRTSGKNLLQVSSEIRGDLPSDYLKHLGDILLKLLPAGSVSGAPKARTLQIIREAENEPRGYYTGVVGIFDGNVFDSGVMIRFVERDGDALYYRSGGGITMQSNVEAEYQEVIDKVYVPIN